MTRQPSENQFALSDGASLFYRFWPACVGRKCGVVVMFHRGHEHSGRLQHIVDELGLEAFDFYAWDARGHGRSPGERGYSPSLARSVRDVDEFVAFAARNSGVPISDVAVVAQSVGAVLASTWVHDYAPKIRALSLASPAFKVKLYVPFARSGLRLQQKLRGNFYVNSYVKAKFLTHDHERIASYEADPLIARPISVNILLELYETAERIVADAGAIVVPTQLLISGADWVVHHGPQHAFFDRLGSKIKEKHILPGFYHDTLGEKERAIALRKIADFIRTRFKEPPGVRSLLDADRRGYTWEEHCKLNKPLLALSPKALGFAVTRLSMATLGKLSEGVRLGFRTGFDSGSTLDYIYRHQARGLTPLGRLFDRNYIESIGWRGIRKRKAHLEELLGEAIRRLRELGKPVHIVDIAAGHGRYVLEAIERVGERPDSVLLRDYSEINVEAGNALIAEKSMQGFARFVQGDAFDAASLASLQPRPTLAVVSGLYELFPDNTMIRRSLGGLGAAVVPGGILLYTGQPWHPQLEFIARVLPSHRDGKPWVMRRRTQAEMDQLVEAAGFEKLGQRIDEWGIFTVSMAQRSDA